MTARALTRRSFLTRTLLTGCSAAASPLWTPVTFAAAPWDARLVVIILRGAMDGLDVVQPLGDPDFAQMRPDATRAGAKDGAIDLDGFYALHPGLGKLVPLWRAGELGFVHAVSTPYRDKRSHFTGQDILEAGVADETGALGSDGWLNRMLQTIPGVEAETTYAIGHGDMRLTRGAAPVSDWSPESALGIGASALRRLETVMRDDPLLYGSLEEAVILSGLAEEDILPAAGMAGGRAELRRMSAAMASDGVAEIAAFAAEKLRGEARIATFSLNGWDTHVDQAKGLTLALDRLQTAILGLKDGLGPLWAKTGVVAMTEFGRTVALNGTGGTDHGTGGAMLTAGGALRGGRVLGDWPGLSEAALYQRRDLMPTRDVRAPAAWIMRGLFGLPRDLLQDTVFPGLEMGEDPGFGT